MFFSFFSQLQISATEIIQAKLNKIPAKIKLQLFGFSVPTWIVNAYQQIGVFGFGAGVCQLTTDIAKYSIGRLRPHFFSVSIFRSAKGLNMQLTLENHCIIIDILTCCFDGSRHFASIFRHALIESFIFLEIFSENAVEKKCVWSQPRSRSMRDLRI